MKLVILLSVFLNVGCSSAQKYPEHWFAPVHDENAPAWEILPQAAGPGEVILSKRNELGILSNFAPTPFVLNGKRYASVEGLWQSMKYPESDSDPRAKAKGVTWPYSRTEVEALSAFKAKRAGKPGSLAMKVLGIDWVTYRSQRMTYQTLKKAAHYNVIVQAMRAKLEQNPEVKEVLLTTGDLVLRPDHKTKSPTPPAWKYYEIWMELRSELEPKSNKSGD